MIKTIINRKNIKLSVTFYKTTVILLSLLCHSNLSAQYADFEYMTELCECKAQFDSTKYSRQQLQNTFDHIYWNNASNIDTHPTDFDKNVPVLLDSLEAEHRRKLEFLEQLDIVDDKFWQRERDKMIKYINSTCELRRVTIRARLDPKELLDYKLVDSTCKYFRDALIAGGDQLLKAWTVLNEIQKKRNGDPEGLQRRFERDYSSPDRLQIARREVMTFGWWNHANALLPHIDDDGYEENFNRLLKDIQCECDEP